MALNAARRRSSEALAPPSTVAKGAYPQTPYGQERTKAVDGSTLVSRRGSGFRCFVDFRFFLDYDRRKNIDS